MTKGNIIILLIFAGFLSCTYPKKKDEQDLRKLNLASNSSIAPGLPNIYFSGDAGMHWQPFATGVPVAATVSAFHINNNRIYAATDAHGIYTLKIGDSNWRRLETDLPKDVDINAITSIQHILVIGTLKNGIFLSINDGHNWQKPARQTPTGPVRSLIEHNRSLFAGSDNGIFKSSDYGRTWLQVYAGGQVNGFTQMNEKVYAATVDGAIMSDNYGNTWRYIYRPLTLHDISNDGTYVYAMTLGAGLLRSKDDGLLWEPVNDGLGKSNFYTFEIIASGGNLFAAQWHGIYRSQKGTIAWNIIHSGLPDSTAFTTLETNGSAIIAGTGLR